MNTVQYSARAERNVQDPPGAQGKGGLILRGGEVCAASSGDQGGVWSRAVTQGKTQ